MFTLTGPYFKSDQNDEPNRVQTIRDTRIYLCKPSTSNHDGTVRREADFLKGSNSVTAFGDAGKLPPYLRSGVVMDGRNCYVV